MSERDNGGPAFPRTVQAWNGNLTPHDGMDLRDWFAGQALAGFYSNPDRMMPVELDGTPGINRVAQAAYQIADAMLAARK